MSSLLFSVKSFILLFRDEERTRSVSKCPVPREILFRLYQHIFIFKSAPNLPGIS